MPHWEIFWTPEAVEHIAEHGVTPEEFRAIVESPERGPEPSRAESDNTVVWGHTPAGRWLQVIYTKIDDTMLLPVTAYEPEPED